MALSPLGTPTPAERRTGRLARRSLGTLAAVGLTALTPFVVLEVKHQGDNAATARLALAKVALELRQQEALEWQAVSRTGELIPIRAGLTLSATNVVNELEVARQHGVAETDVERVRGIQTRYTDLVQRELDLLATGDDDGAVHLDNARVEPVQEEFLRVVDSLARRQDARLRSASSHASTGILTAMLLALVLVTWLQRQIGATRARASRLSESRYRSLVHQSADLVLVTDVGNRLTYLSPAAERALQTHVTSLGLPVGPGLSLRSLMHADDWEQWNAGRGRAGHTPMEIRFGSDEHGYRLYEVAVRDLTSDEAVGGWVLTAHDVTESRRLQAELSRAAMHDPLTDLPNRAMLSSRMHEALAAAAEGGRPTALLLLDLNEFKEINDTLGHQVGDDVLVQVGTRLADTVRNGDTVARLGGDEFAVLLPAVGTLDQARAVADKLLACLTQPMRVGDTQLVVGASIGLVLTGTHGDEESVLLQRADVAMYVAKRSGGGLAVYDTETDPHTKERLGLPAELRRALANDEMVLHYQPQVCLVSGELVGVEALVRWQHPTRGLLAPAAFIAVAEDSGLVCDLTLLVIDHAAAQARTWLDDGQPLPVAVNISALDLAREALVDDVARILAFHDVPPWLLALELTESAAVTEPERAGRVVAQLRALGVRVSIDDFGAGYTSLAHLRRLEASELKVDRAIVSAMTDNETDALIVRSLVQIGHQLDMVVVAEGVETVAEIDMLVDAGCDVVQGYFLSRPLPVADLDRWRTAFTGVVLPGMQARTA